MVPIYAFMQNIFSYDAPQLLTIGFKGRIWVLIAPVPGHCILVTVKEVEKDILCKVNAKTLSC